MNFLTEVRDKIKAEFPDITQEELDLRTNLVLDFMRIYNIKQKSISERLRDRVG